MTSEPGSAAMEQFEPLEKVFIRWARGADGSLNIRRWSQFPFDGATEYGDPVVLTRERDEAREALKPFANLFLDTTRRNGVWCKDYVDSRDFICVDPITISDFTMADIRRARAALAGGKQE